MKSPFAAGLGPGGPRTLYLLGVISAIKALGLLGIAEALALGISSLFDGADGWQGAAVLGAVSVLARAGASWLTQWFATRASLGAKESLRAQLADRLTEGSELGVGEATALATRGLDDLDPYYRTVLPAAVGAAVIPLAVGARILFVDPLSALIVALTVPLIPVFMILIGQHTRDRVDAAAGSLALLSDHLVELARGLPVLVGLGRLDEQSAALSRISQQYRTRTMATLRTAFLSALALELIATISVALVAVTVGIRLIGGDLTLQVGLLVLILAPECYTPLREIGVAFHASQDGVAALDRVRAALRTSDRKDLRQRSESSSAALDVRGLTVTYDGRDAAAVDGLSFTVAPGETVALTGPSGAGKSTVLRAIAGRLVPARGDIVGSEQIAWLPQHPRTVADTVSEELALYGPSGASIDELLDQLGLGASGASDPAELSPGELRRLAFARALLRVEAGADLLLLDEPTAHLDAASARIIERKIASLRGGPAVVLVSHDPRVTALADRLVAVGVDGGVALGTADDAAGGDPAVASAPTQSTSSRAADSGNPAAGSAESLRLLASLLRPVRWRLAPAVALGVLAALSAAALTAVSGWLIVRAAQEPAIMYLLVAIVGVRFFGIARSALRYAERLVTHDTVFASVVTLRGRLWSAIARRGTASPALRRTGTALDLLVITADQIRDLTPRVLLPPLVGAATVAAALITVGLLHPAVLPAYAVGTGGALVLAPLIALLGDRHSSAGEAAIRSTVARRIGSLLGASDDLRGNGVDGPIRAALRALDERASRDARRSSWARGLGSAVVVAALGGTAIGMVALCAPAVAAGTLGVEVVAVLALLPLGLIDPLLAVVEAVQQWPALTAALGRLAPVLGASGEKRVTDDRFGEEVRRADSLELDDVSARWAPDAEPVFVGASARVERGQWLAVTGPSGSGKTTMLSVLLRYLEPASGRYLVDGTDARALDSDSVRSRLAWTPQEAHLFSSTIRGNLLLARQPHDRPTDAELRSVLEHVGLGPLVEGMADGLDTMVGAGGAALSGGEAQRLAVARALLSRSDVVLLDEPTAHLDAETASHMMADLRGALADRAVVLVTHRADDLQASDLKVTLGDRVPPRRATVPVPTAR